MSSGRAGWWDSPAARVQWLEEPKLTVSPGGHSLRRQADSRWCQGPGSHTMVAPFTSVPPCQDTNWCTPFLSPQERAVSSNSSSPKSFYVVTPCFVSLEKKKDKKHLYRPALPSLQLKWTDHSWSDRRQPPTGHCSSAPLPFTKDPLVRRDLAPMWSILLFYRTFWFQSAASRPDDGHKCSQEMKIPPQLASGTFSEFSWGSVLRGGRTTLTRDPLPSGRGIGLCSPEQTLGCDCDFASSAPPHVVPPGLPITGLGV